MKPTDAEWQRAYQELVEACKQLDTENQRLRAMLKRGVPEPEPKPEPLPVLPPAPISVGQLVLYVDKGGIEHLALVKQVLEGDALRVKVFRTARPNDVLDLHEVKDDKQRDCWKRRN